MNAPHPLKGKPKSPEHRAAMSAAAKARGFTPEHRAKITAKTRDPDVNARRIATFKATMARRAAQALLPHHLQDKHTP